MQKKLFSATLFTLLLVSTAHAQNYEAMIQQQLQQGNNMAAQMQQMQHGIVQQNMQNPQIQAMYQQYRANGGPMSFEQFAYSYAATAGFTADGMQRWNQNEQNIQRRDQQALEQYRQNQAQNAAAMQQMHERNSQIAHERGNLLNGTTDYNDPSNGGQYNLPHTIQPNTYYQEPGTGQMYYNDMQGNYFRRGPDGYWYPLNQ